MERVEESAQETAKRLGVRLYPSLGMNPDGSAAKKYECDLCKDVGSRFVRTDGDGFGPGAERHKVCECVERKHAAALLRSSHMSDELQQKSFGNFDTNGRPQCVKDAYECAYDYFRRFDASNSQLPNSIALLGASGAGKTHLLAAIANNIRVKKEVNVLYFPYVEGLDEIRADLDKAEEKFQAMKDVDVLFIDDLYKGREIPTPWEMTKIFGVINYRYLHRKRILICSEKDVDRICEIDMAIGTRIYEMCKSHTAIIRESQGVTVKDLNYRLKGV